MKPRRRNLMHEVAAQQERAFDQDLEIGRIAVDRAFEQRAESIKIQRVIDAIARTEFRHRFELEPILTGAHAFGSPYGTYTAPVFAVEYANVRFVPGEHMVSAVKDPHGIVSAYKMPRKGLLRRQAPAQADLDMATHHAYVLAALNSHGFEPVGLCSGCEQWANLLEFREDSYKSLREKGLIKYKPPYELEARSFNVNNYEDVAAHIQTFGEVTSGLAYDCGKADIFELSLSRVSAIVACPNVQKILAERKDISSPYPQK